ncbi:hypothetical protein HMPREF1141_0910 [Clostridium sp. MSTE9]|nr:hypothetical protein HMPREF1141_0910 [Clostridium sp. MSTE9]
MTTCWPVISLCANKSHDLSRKGHRLTEAPAVFGQANLRKKTKAWIQKKIGNPDMKKLIDEVSFSRLR